LSPILLWAWWSRRPTSVSHLASQYRRLVGRRGKMRALVAVGHSILVIFYHMTRRAACYTDLGGDFFERLEPNRLKRYYVHRLERLGYTVALESTATA
jgi:transposase